MKHYDCTVTKVPYGTAHMRIQQKNSDHKYICGHWQLNQDCVRCDCAIVVSYI